MAHSPAPSSASPRCVTEVDLASPHRVRRKSTTHRPPQTSITTSAQVRAHSPTQPVLSNGSGVVLDQRTYESLRCAGVTAELTSTILTADELRDLVERMLKVSGCRVDLSSSLVDLRLADRSCLHVVIPGTTRGHGQVDVAKFVVQGRASGCFGSVGPGSRQSVVFL